MQWELQVIVPITKASFRHHTDNVNKFQEAGELLLLSALTFSI